MKECQTRGYCEVWGWKSSLLQIQSLPSPVAGNGGTCVAHLQSIALRVRVSLLQRAL
jgi:lipopolysaccharide biosynthesis protein